MTKTKNTPWGARVIAADAMEETPALGRTRQWLLANQARRFKRCLPVLAGPHYLAASHAVETWPWETYERLPRRVAFQDILGPWHHSPGEPIGYDNRTGLNRLDLLTTPLLMLDGVGAEVGEASKYGEVLGRLLKTRCDQFLATVITTNFEYPTARCRRCRRECVTCDAEYLFGDQECDAAHPRLHGSGEENAIVGVLTRYGSRAELIGERFVEFGEWVHCPEPTERHGMTGE